MAAAKEASNKHAPTDRSVRPVESASAFRRILLPMHRVLLQRGIYLDMAMLVGYRGYMAISRYIPSVANQHGHIK
eukprot:8348430-Pyramimonas_sp.AAC.1